MTDNSVELRGEPDKDYEAEVLNTDLDRVARIELHLARVEDAAISMRNLIAAIMVMLIFMGLIYFSVVLYVLFFAPKAL